MSEGRFAEIKAHYEALGDTPAPCAVDGVLADVPWLLAEVERLRAEQDALRRGTYRMISPLTEGTPVQYLGVYVLRWQRGWGTPEVGFVETEEADDE